MCSVTMHRLGGSMQQPRNCSMHRGGGMKSEQIILHRHSMQELGEPQSRVALVPDPKFPGFRYAGLVGLRLGDRRRLQHVLCLQQTAPAQSARWKETM